jgi:acetyltransferase-like isoleucine patch superfamily enzyme
MVPGMSEANEGRLRPLLVPSVTDVREDLLTGRPVTLLAAHEDEARALGIQFEGGPELTIAVTDTARRLGQVRVQTGGHRNTIFFDNRSWGGNFYAAIRIAGDDTFMMFNQIGDEYVHLPDIYLRTSQQFLFWGTGASAVSCSLEIDGLGQGVVIGDDALISGGVWIRNYDMHAMHDLLTGRRINRAPCDTVLERHVWLGQDALLLSCERVGMGSIIGARALVKGSVPARVAAAGTPARVIREGVSWGRHPYSMTVAERVSIGLPEQPEV